MKVIPDGPSTDAILSAAAALAMEIKVNASRSGGVTVVTAQPVTSAQKVETEIIPIVGDSHPPEVITRVP